MLIPDEGLHAFMQHCSQKIGEAYFRTPRNTITTFVNLLAVLEQNPETQWDDLLERVELPEDRNPDLAPLEDSNDEEDEGPGGGDREDRGEGGGGDGADEDDLHSLRL